MIKISVVAIIVFTMHSVLGMQTNSTVIGFVRLKKNIISADTIFTLHCISGPNNLREPNKLYWQQFIGRLPALQNAPLHETLLVEVGINGSQDDEIECMKYLPYQLIKENFCVFEPRTIKFDYQPLNASLKQVELLVTNNMEWIDWHDSRHNNPIIFSGVDPYALSGDDADDEASSSSDDSSQSIVYIQNR